jgi:hypothetical protein
MRSDVPHEVLAKHYAWQKTLPNTNTFYIPKDISRERNFIVACNYAYDVLGESPVPDHVYEFVVGKLEEYKKYCPKEWNSCDIFHDYFVKNDDWEYTGSGVPNTDRAKALANYLFKKWNKESKIEQ